MSCARPIEAAGTVSMVIVMVFDKALHPALSVTLTVTVSKLAKSENVSVLTVVVVPAGTATETPFLKNSYPIPPEAVNRTVSPKQAVFVEAKVAVGEGSTVIVISLLKSVQSRPLKLEIIFLRKDVVVVTIAEGVKTGNLAAGPKISPKGNAPVLVSH